MFLSLDHIHGLWVLGLLFSFLSPARQVIAQSQSIARNGFYTGILIRRAGASVSIECQSAQVGFLEEGEVWVQRLGFIRPHSEPHSQRKKSQIQFATGAHVPEACSPLLGRPRPVRPN